MPSPADATILRGTHFEISIRFLLDGTPWPSLSAWEPRAELRNAGVNPQTGALVPSKKVLTEFELDVDDAESTIVLRLPDTFTETLSPKTYWWDIDFFDPDEVEGKKVVTWPTVDEDRCMLTVQVDVTRNPTDA